MFSKIYEENNFSGQIGFKNLKVLIIILKIKIKPLIRLLPTYQIKNLIFDNCIAQNSKTKKILSPNILLNKKNSRFEKIAIFCL